jgi:NADH-quinone oxidoreductase subunit K
MTVQLESQLAVGAILFALGAIVSINLTAFGRHHGNASGQVFTIFVLTIAACEAGLALALILNLYQRRKSLDVQLWSSLGEPDLPQLAPEEAAPPAPSAPELPHLTPAGPLPKTPAAGVWSKI